MDKPKKKGQLRSIDEARNTILAAIPMLVGSEQLTLRQALGRMLATSLEVPFSLPRDANSAMDGYAIRTQDLSPHNTTDLKVIGTAFAGNPFMGQVGAGESVRIMTGAPIPEGADCVVMQEYVTKPEEGIVRLEGTHPVGDNIRQIGEDLQAGSELFPAGTRLRAAEIGVLASMGICEVRVRRQPTVAFFSTGDELTPLGTALTHGKIYDSNRYLLYGLLHSLPVHLLDLGVVPDQPQALTEALQHAQSVADVIITTGGVSVGDADYIKDLLAELGEMSFWKIAIKPGKPLAFGRIGRSWLFGLPGNPVSSFVTFMQFVAPALRHMAGEQQVTPWQLTAKTLDPIKKQPGRAYVVGGVIDLKANEEATVRLSGKQGSHILSSMSRANCFIILPAEWETVPAGTLVTVELWQH